MSKDSVDLTKYDIHYEFNDRTRRGEIKVFEKIANYGDERRLIGMVYKDSISEKIWTVCGTGSDKEYFSPKDAVIASIKHDSEVKEMILNLRKDMGQTVK